MPTSEGSLDHELLGHMDDLEELRNSSSLELLLILEFEWLVYTDILHPLLVAKLLVESIPSFPDTYMVANLVAQIATQRGICTAD